jgi:hypothetical protein
MTQAHLKHNKRELELVSQHASLESTIFRLRTQDCITGDRKQPQRMRRCCTNTFVERQPTRLAAGGKWRGCTPALSPARTWSLRLSFNTASSAHRLPACSLLDGSVVAPSLVGRETCTAALRFLALSYTSLASSRSNSTYILRTCPEGACSRHDAPPKTPIKRRFRTRLFQR